MAEVKPKKVVVPKKQTILYKMKAVISTGMYSNIQPEITVEAETVEEAQELIIPALNALHERYYMSLDKQKRAPQAETPKTTQEVQVTYSQHFHTVRQAILNCMDVTILETFVDRIKASEKLSSSEKDILLEVVRQKETELDGTVHTS